MLAGLVEALRGLDRGAEPTDQEWATRNALLESFTLHARSLADFFYAASPKPDDAIADDFFDDDTWRRQRVPENRGWRRFRRRVGKEIAHLTYKRHDPYDEAATWPHGQIFLELVAVVGEFVRLVPPERLHPEFEARADEALSTPAGFYRRVLTGGLANQAAATAGYQPAK